MSQSQSQSQSGQSATSDQSDQQTQPIEDAVVSTAEDPVRELDKYWKCVKDNPSDFTGWTYLLQYVEQEGKVEDAEDAFEAFLQHYPYCYGYWKKFADLEKKFDRFEKTEEVFEKGLRAVPLSIDLWIHFINFKSHQLENEETAEGKIRGLFERSIAAAGTDFRSDKLWDMYLYWEQEKKNLLNITTLCDRVLAIPTQLYSHHFDNFCEHVKGHHPKDIVPLDEFLEVRKKVVAQKEKNATLDIADVNGGEEEDAKKVPDVSPPGNEEASETPDDAAPGTQDEKVKIDDDDEEVQAIRDEIIESRRTVHKQNEQEVSRRWSYEEAIRRPYFHVKPLEKVQLRNWSDYLDFEMTHGTHERTVILFERCLIACALYEEFWLKYAKYLESHSVEASRTVFRRGCTIHLKKKPTLHLAWSAFEERRGNFTAALQVLNNLEAEVPGLMMVVMRKISLTRRNGSPAEVEEMFKDYIEKTDNNEARSFFAIKYARYLLKVRKNFDAAKDIIQSAIVKNPTNAKLYLQLIDQEYQQQSMKEEKIVEGFKLAIDSPLTLEHRLAFSQRRLEYLEDFSCNVLSLQEAYDSHQQLVKELQLHKAKKRKSKDESKDAKSGEKRAKAEPSETATAKDTATNGTDVAKDNSQVTTEAKDYNAAYNAYAFPPPPVMSHDGQRHGDDQNYSHMPYAYSNSWPNYNASSYAYNQATGTGSWAASYGSQFFPQ